MADQVNNQNPQGTPNGADPTKTGAEEPKTLDLSKVSDDEFGKIFEDKRLWNHPRFKELNEAKQKLKAQEDEAAKKEEERLKKQGEFEQVAKNKEQEVAQWQSKYKNSVIDNKILAEAQKVGAQDTEAVLKLIDRSNIKIDDSDVVSGVEDAVKSLVEAKPYLKGTSSATLGAGANPQGANTTTRKFKLSEIQDAQFYRDNRDEIRKAQAAGLIENDLY